MDRLPERLRAHHADDWMGPHGHVVTYPLRRGELLNFVAAVERSDWEVESWSEAGTKVEIKADLAPWHVDVQTIIDSIDVPYKWALLVREPLPRWSVGRVTLLGDACVTRHCHSWRRAPTWRSRTEWYWRGAWRPIPM